MAESIVCNREKTYNCVWTHNNGDNDGGGEVLGGNDVLRRGMCITRWEWGGMEGRQRQPLRCRKVKDDDMASSLGLLSAC